MAIIQRSALLPYSSAQIFELINDVAAYPDYMDGCVGATIISQTESVMEARLDLEKAGLKYHFTTCNNLYPPHKMVMNLVDGPFTHFKGEWQLKPLSEEACKVSLVLDFALKTRGLGGAVKKLFDPMANNLVDAIVKRAHQLHR